MLHLEVQIRRVYYANNPSGQNSKQLPVNGSENIGVVHVGTQRFVRLSAYIFYVIDKHLYLHVFTPFESICP